MHHSTRRGGSRRFWLNRSRAGEIARSYGRHRWHLSIEQLEARHLLAVVMWDGEADVDEWTDPANWDTNSLPGRADDVVIPAGVGTVTIRAARAEVNSIEAQSALEFTGVTVTAGRIKAPQLSLIGGAVLTSPGVELKLEVDITGGILLLDATSRIDVSAKGYATGRTKDDAPSVLGATR